MSTLVCITTCHNSIYFQVKNAKDETNREFRISHDALFNIFQLCYQLKTPSRKGDLKDFISLMTLHPRIIIHLTPWAVLESLEQLLKISTYPVALHYDTVFNIGDYYLSILTFRHGLFIGNPIIPCAYMIHSRRYHSDHCEFLKAVTAIVPVLTSKQVNIITDREFKFDNSILPVGNHLYCWNHLENDLYWHLKKTSNCTAEQITYFTNAFKNLMISHCNEIDFDASWKKLKQDKEFVSSNKVLNYFEDRLIPAFKAHSAIWTLRAAGIVQPENGITNNPSESMNAVLHRLKQWKNVPLDVVASSLYHLSVFHHREIERSIHQCGRWNIKDEFDHFRREPSLMPFMEKAMDPKDIVERAHADIVLESCQAPHEKKSPSPCDTTSQSSLACLAVENNRVKLVGRGAWIVIDPDGITHHAVRLLPKETCTCPSPKTCYHINACRIMVGLQPAENGKCSLSELQRKDRKTKERPAGRKVPRRNDFNQPEENMMTGPDLDGIFSGKYICIISPKGSSLSLSASAIRKGVKTP